MGSQKPARGFRTAVVAAIIAAAAFAFAATRTQLLNIVGYELGAATAFLLAVICSALGIYAGAEKIQSENFSSPHGRHPQTRLGVQTPDREADHNTHKTSLCAPPTTRRSILRKYFRCISIGALAIALPLAVVAVNTYFFQKCNLRAGIGIFLWITIPAVLHYTAAGLAAGRVFRTTARAAIALIAYFVATSVFTFALFMIGSRWTLPNLTVGLFSTTGFYGFEMSVPADFYASRLLAAFMSVFFLGVAVLANPLKKIRPRADVIAGRAAVAASMLVFLVCAIFFPDQTGLGSGRRTLNRALSGRYETPNAVLHHSPGGLTPEQAERTARFTEWFLFEISEAVPMNPDWKVHVYLYDDDAQMERLIGATDYYFSAPWLHEVHVQYRSVASSIYKHELTHAMMSEYGRGIFGTPYNIGVVEGIAVAVEENYFRGPAFQEQFAAAVRAKNLAPAQQTMSLLGFGSSGTWKSYEMAGGFTGFLIHAYGPEKYSRFYSAPNARNIKRIYGKDIEALNVEWIEWLKGVEVSPHALRTAQMAYDDVMFPPFYRTQCPRVGRRLDPDDPLARLDSLSRDRDYVQYAAACEQIFDMQPDPKWIVRQAGAYLKAGQYDDALAAADRALAADKISNPMRDNALLIRALTLAAAGKLVDALHALDARAQFGFAAPDDTEKIARVIQRESVRDILLPAYIDTKLMDAPLLEKAIAADPRFGPPYAELAFRLDKKTFDTEKEYVEKLEELTEKFLTLTDGLEDTKRKLLTRLGDTLTDTADYTAAISAYKQLLSLSSTPKQHFTANRRIQRAEFFEKFNPENI